MDTKLDALSIKANELKAITTVFSDTFASGSVEDMIRSITAQPDTFSYLVHIILNYVCEITQTADNLFSTDFFKDYPTQTDNQ